MPSTSGEKNAVNMDRRCSNASDTSLEDGAAVRKLSLQEGAEFIPTRSSKVTPPKPAANPLQFIKVGPCDLYKSAQEQIKRVEEVKRIKETVKEEAEDWQSNLDNWKCSRRKRQEHIIERVVEVKKLELEEHDRNRRRSKTFNEMMEERNSRGRKTSLMVFKDDEANDLSDLGIGTSSGDDNQSLSDRDERPSNGSHDDNHSLSDRDERPTNGNDGDTILESSKEFVEEYTYDRAIQTYVNFTETRVKARNNINEDSKPTEIVTNGHKEVNKKTPPQIAAKPKRETGSKVEEKLSFLEERRRSSTDLSTSDKVKLAKVDVLKRRERFEKGDNEVKSPSKVLVNNSQSIKDRLSSLEKQGEVNGVKNVNRLSGEITGSIKDRLTSLERQKSTETLNGKEELLRKRLSNGDMSPPQSVKERLSSLNRQGSTDDCKDNLTASKAVGEVTIKDRLSNLDSAVNKDVKKVMPDRDPTFSSKLANFQNEEMAFDVSVLGGKPLAGSERSSSPDEDEIYATKRQQFHRSLDSLDVEGDLGNGPFERVQSLEELDCLGRRNYPPSASSTEMLVFSSQSGDTDREDSGIHTADVSSSVSQADEPVEDGDHLDHFLDIETVGHRRQISELSEQLSPLPPIQEIETLETSTVFLLVDDALEKAQSDDEPLEAVIASRQPVPDTMMLAARETVVMSSKEEAAIDNSFASDDAITFDDCQEVASEIHTSPDEEACEAEKQLDNGRCEEKKTETSTLPLSAYSGLFNAKSGEEIFLPMSTSELLPVNLNADNVELLGGGLAFPLAPPSSVEPPKEKPPPPPAESDDEVPKPKSSLRRIDSTKRIKKELRRKRSDFLGIEGNVDDDSYLEPVLSVAPPDMTAFLIEEQRQEKQLYRQSICSESDSNPGESRDSGVELDRPQVLTPDRSAQHSRQESEIYGNASITSEEDEITKKEREIIEILEKEEQWRYANNPSEEDLGEKLAEKLRQLEQEKLRLEWERAEEENRRMTEEGLRREEKMRLRAKEQELRQQENPANEPSCNGDNGDGSNLVEAIRAERERLQREQEELMSQRENLIMRETQQVHRNAQQWDVHPSSAMSLQDISQGAGYQLPPVVPPAPLNYRLSLPDLQEQAICEQQSGRKSHRPPPPIPPSKPLRTVVQEQQERENSIKNSRIPSAELNYTGEGGQSRHGSGSSSHSQQMTRQTLQALSAAPRSRIVSTDTWIQAKKKPESQRNNGQGNNNYNYQHWLIQEAEHRRITEQHQRNAAPVSPRKSTPVSPHPPSPQWTHPQQQREKPLPDAIIQTLTQRVQNRAGLNDNKTSPPRREHQNQMPQKQMQISPSNSVPNTNVNKNGPSLGNGPMMHNGPNMHNGSAMHNSPPMHNGTLMNNSPVNHSPIMSPATNGDSQEKMLSVSGKKKCSHCGEELGRGAAMIIESLRLFYHIDCFKCCVCHVQLGDGLMGTDVRVRNNKLHCHNCYSSDDGVKFSCV